MNLRGLGRRRQPEASASVISTIFDGIVDVVIPSGCDILAVGITVSHRIVITGRLHGAINTGFRGPLASFRTLIRFCLRAFWPLLYHLRAILPISQSVDSRLCPTISNHGVAPITCVNTGVARTIACVHPRIARRMKRSISFVKLGAVKLDKSRIEERYSTYECRCRGGGEKYARGEIRGRGGSDTNKITHSEPYLVPFLCACVHH